MHRESVVRIRSANSRPACNVERARELLGDCSRQHVYNLFNRGAIVGFFIGSNRGLRLYIDSIERYKQQQSGEALIADGYHHE